MKVLLTLRWKSGLETANTYKMAEGFRVLSKAIAVGGLVGWSLESEPNHA